MFKVLLGIISVTLIWGYTWVTMKIAITDIPLFYFRHCGCSLEPFLCL